MAEPVSRSGFLLAAAAGVTGAAGVTLAAIAAHKVESPALVTAATMLMVHAAAAVGLSALAVRGTGRGWVGVGTLMLAAVALFSGDVTVHTLTGNHLFPYAAPTGGSLTIASWLAVAVAAIYNARRAS